MRRFSILFSIVTAGCLLAAPAMGAGPLKIKFVQSIYAGNEDIGLNHPEGVACTDDVFVVADTGNDRLVKYTYQDKTVQPTELDIPINSPSHVQVNSKGEIFALSRRDGRILMFNPDGTEKGYLSPKGSPVARKMVPRSFKIDGNDRIYILDLSDEVVLILDPQGNYLRHIVFPPAQNGFFSDLAVDKQGTIYVIDSIGAVLYSAGEEADQFSVLSRDLKEYVNFPTNIALDSSGIIYLVDKHGGSLVLLNPDGSFLGHKFGYGWKESQFYYPTQLCISGGGNFFVADRGNSRVQMFEMED